MSDNSNSMAANLVAKRGNRVTASILGFLEETLYRDHPEITTKEQKKIRQVILDGINEFKDLAIDIVKSETAIVNELWVQKIDELHKDLRHIKERV